MEAENALKLEKQPPPINKGKRVPDLFIRWISKTESLDEESKDFAIQLIRARSKYGEEKYGQPLMTEDGRNVGDAIEELGDLLQYAFRSVYKGEDVSKLKLLLPILDRLINEENSATLNDHVCVCKCKK